MAKATEMATKGKDAKVGLDARKSKTELKPYPEENRDVRRTHPSYSRKALIVGINRYQNPANNLNGCEPDAVDTYDTLLINGFPRTQRKLLLNEKATKNNIMQQLDKLVDDTERGDVRVFYYSGHGTQIDDADGDETDVIDEALCPHDISFDNGTYIIDDELHEIFSKLHPQASCDVIFDSCFSGSATRSLGNSGGYAMKTQNYEVPVYLKKQRYMPPPRDMLGRINTSIPSRTKLVAVGKSIITTKGGQINTLWAASQDYQVAWEMDIGGQVRGAFTHALMRIFRRSNGNIRRQQAYEILRTTMANEGYEQIPNLEPGSDMALQEYSFRRPHENEPSEIKEEPGQ